MCELNHFVVSLFLTSLAGLTIAITDAIIYSYSRLGVNTRIAFGYEATVMAFGSWKH